MTLAEMDREAKSRGQSYGQYVQAVEERVNHTGQKTRKEPLPCGEKYRTLYELVEAGLNAKEISEALGISTRAVYSRLERAGIETPKRRSMHERTSGTH